MYGHSNGVSSVCSARGAVACLQSMATIHAYDITYSYTLLTFCKNSGMKGVSEAGSLLAVLVVKYGLAALTGPMLGSAVSDSTTMPAAREPISLIMAGTTPWFLPCFLLTAAHTCI